MDSGCLESLEQEPDLLVLGLRQLGDTVALEKLLRSLWDLPLLPLLLKSAREIRKRTTGQLKLMTELRFDQLDLQRGELVPLLDRRRLRGRLLGARLGTRPAARGGRGRRSNTGWHHRVPWRHGREDPTGLEGLHDLLLQRLVERRLHRLRQDLTLAPKSFFLLLLGLSLDKLTVLVVVLSKILARRIQARLTAIV